MPHFKPVFCAVALVAFAVPALAQPTSCMVLGEPTARIASSQGEKSPVFVAADCSSLKLVSGKAQASWIGRDGKPHVVPLSAQGLSAVPQAGSEERSVNVVLAEFTTQRERQQAAYMRSVGTERPPRVYLPGDGLVVVQKLDGAGVLRITPLVSDGTKSAAGVRERMLAAGEPVRIAREALEPDTAYVIQIQRGDLVEEWRWRVVSATDSASIDAHRASIRAEVQEPNQRGLMDAMLYEQLKLRPNMELALQELRVAALPPSN